MSEYQGLNLPQLLDLLKPIVHPDPVSLLPMSAGWWILSGWLLGLVLIGLWRWRLQWRANQYRREAQAEIDSLLRQTDLDSSRLVAAIAAVLKRTALAAYPRVEVAGLTGTAWAEFLAASCRNDPEVAAAAQSIADAAYRADVDPAVVIAPARRWIALHRV